MSRKRIYTDEQVAEVKRRFALFVANKPKQIARDLQINPRSVRSIVGREYRERR